MVISELKRGNKFSFLENRENDLCEYIDRKKVVLANGIHTLAVYSWRNKVFYAALDRPVYLPHY